MKMILGITGEMASGKGTSADYLKRKKGAVIYKFSSSLRDITRRLYLEETRENLQKASTMVRETFGQDILCKVIHKDVEKDQNELIVIDGVRRQQDVQEFSKLKEFKLVYIETSLEKRFERIKKRTENIDDKDKTFEEFQIDNQREAEREIKKLKDEADFVVDNNGSFEDLYRQIDEIVE
jgi:dephospho-CoA kinase